MIRITKERPEIDRLIAEGRRLIAIRNGEEYVFDVPDPVASAEKPARRLRRVSNEQ